MGWFDQNLPVSQAPMAGRAPYNPNLPLDQQAGYPGGPTLQPVPVPGGANASVPIPGAGGSTLPSDPQQAFMAAAAALNIPLNQTRGRSTEIVNYLIAHGQPGWQAGGTQADDWVKTPQGQGIDYSAAGSNAFQWNNDNTGSSMGALGGQWQGGPMTMPDTANFEGSPGFQWALAQGLKGLERAGSSRGNFLSGGQRERELQYGIGAASQDYGNYFNRAFQTNQANFGNQFSLANLGATTARNG